MILNKVHVRINENTNPQVNTIRATRRVLRQIERAIIEDNVPFAASLVASVVEGAAKLNSDLSLQSLKETSRVHVVTELPEEGRINGRVAIASRDIRKMNSLEEPSELTLAESKAIKAEAKRKEHPLYPILALLESAVSGK